MFNPLFFPDREIIEERHEQPERQESARREDENRLRVLPEAVGEGDVEEGGGSENFPRSPEKHERKREAEAHPEPVRDGRGRPVLARERFRAAENDAVHDNEREENPQSRLQFREIRRHDKLHERDEGRDDDDENRDPHLVRHKAFDKRNDEVGKHEDEGRGQPHADGFFYGRGCGEGGTHAENNDEDGIFLEQAFEKLFRQIHFDSSGSFCPQLQSICPTDFQSSNIYHDWPRRSMKMTNIFLFITCGNKDLFLYFRFRGLLRGDGSERFLPVFLRPEVVEGGEAGGRLLHRGAEGEGGFGVAFLFEVDEAEVEIQMVAADGSGSVFSGDGTFDEFAVERFEVFLEPFFAEFRGKGGSVFPCFLHIFFRRKAHDKRRLRRVEVAVVGVHEAGEVVIDVRVRGEALFLNLRKLPAHHRLRRLIVLEHAAEAFRLRAQRFDFNRDLALNRHQSRLQIRLIGEEFPEEPFRLVSAEGIRRVPRFRETVLQSRVFGGEGGGEEFRVFRIPPKASMMHLLQAMLPTLYLRRWVWQPPLP